MRLNLDQTWEQCIKMWEFVCRSLRHDPDQEVNVLKERWMRKNYPPHVYVDYNCFFCDYDNNRRNENGKSGQFCMYCPGKKVDKDFNCEDPAYHWMVKSHEFLKKIKALNKQRKQK